MERPTYLNKSVFTLGGKEGFQVQFYLPEIYIGAYGAYGVRADCDLMIRPHRGFTAGFHLFGFGFGFSFPEKPKPKEGGR